MPPIPILHAGAIFCVECGGTFHQHRGYLLYTGPEWCECKGYVCVIEHVHNEDDCYEVPKCYCNEFMPIDEAAFEVANA